MPAQNDTITASADGKLRAGVPFTVGIPAHIQAAAEGEWTAISNNTLNDAGFDYVANPPPVGYRTTINAIMYAWSGGVYSDATEDLLVNGGGHRDYDGNESYAFNLTTATWRRINDPSLFLEEDADADFVYPDGTPGPIHTYGILGYNPDNNKMYRLGRSGSPLKNVWEFDLTTLEWAEIPGTSVAVENNEGSAAWDSVSKEFVIVTKDIGTNGRIRRFDPSTNTLYIPPGSDFAGLTKSQGFALSEARREVIWRATASAGPPHWGIYNIDTHVKTTATGTPAGSGLLAAGAPSLQYDAVRDRYVGWSDNAADSRTLWFMDPDTYSITEFTPTGGSVPVLQSVANRHGAYGRFFYSRKYDIYGVVTRTDDAVHIFKPSGWSPL